MKKIIFSFTLLFFAVSCASVNGVKNTNMISSAQLTKDEPCWVSSPNCMAAGDKFIYFSGQSDRDYPSRGRPERSAYESARKDAERQYADYLGVEITSTTINKDRLTNEKVDSEFQQAIEQTLNQTVSDLQKVDEYFIAHTINKKGEYNWRVFVLMRIPRNVIDKNRETLAREVEKNKISDQKLSQKQVWHIKVGGFTGKFIFKVLGDGTFSGVSEWSGGSGGLVNKISGNIKNDVFYMTRYLAGSHPGKTQHWRGDIFKDAGLVSGTCTGFGCRNTPWEARIE